MAAELEKIAQAFRLLASVEMPDGYLSELEVAVVNAYIEATKVERAKHLLATRGRRVAAIMLGCSEAQVYRLANMTVRKDGACFPESSADLESVA